METNLHKTKHSKCKGYMTDDPINGKDYGCKYGTILTCDECKYGMGRKDPNAKCNRLD